MLDAATRKSESIKMVLYVAIVIELCMLLPNFFETIALSVLSISKISNQEAHCLQLRPGSMYKSPYKAYLFNPLHCNTNNTLAIPVNKGILFSPE